MITYLNPGLKNLADNLSLEELISTLDRHPIA